MRIEGKMKYDQNFVTVCTGDAIYQIARNNPAAWGVRRISETAGDGVHTVTPEVYAEIEAECTETGWTNIPNEE